MLIDLKQGLGDPMYEVQLIIKPDGEDVFEGSFFETSFKLVSLCH